MTAPTRLRGHVERVDTICAMPMKYSSQLGRSSRPSTRAAVAPCLQACASVSLTRSPSASVRTFLAASMRATVQPQRGGAPSLSTIIRGSCSIPPSRGYAKVAW